MITISLERILEILGPYVEEKYFSNPFVKINNKQFEIVSNIIEEDASNAVIFYNVENLNLKSEKGNAFKEKVLKFHKGILVINQKISLNDLFFSEILQQDNYYQILCVKPDFFLECQKILLDVIIPLELSGKSLVGITGTNGKTTTVEICRQISNQMGVPSFSLGTLGVVNLKGQKIQTTESLTTPSYIDLRKILFEMFKNHEVGFMEVSSHALYSQRLFKLKLDIIAWTNLTQDHLDFHGSFENYFLSKMKIFNHVKFNNQKLLIPTNQIELRDKIGKEKVSINVLNISQATLNYPKVFHTNYNEQNLELALNICQNLFKKEMPKDLTFLKLPEGRFNLINFDINKDIIIDFAHTPDALLKLLEGVRELYPKRKVKLIFGCGGDRDKGKRPLMGKVASQLADEVYLTQDNSRTESSKDIIKDILSFDSNIKKFTIIMDRRTCLETVLGELKSDEVLVIAGKGNENYQIIGIEKVPYSDEKVVCDFINKMKE
jgi:UDP-N-acetylmuramoyl-L-alanyl-D-glutamate--2,6-diaminopimelate ligase